MLELIASGRVVDFALLLLCIEALLLTVHLRRTGRSRAARDLVFHLAAGAFLLLALRAALTGAPVIWIALAMAAALPVHLFDLYRRTRRAPV